MKSAHWAGALLVLAVMVFAITYAMIYLGDSGPPKKEADGGQDLPRLTFFEGNTFPPGGGMRYPCESNKPGGHNFWFHNANDEALTVGLIDDNGAPVELAVLPPQGLGRLALLSVGPSLALAAGRLNWAALLMGQQEQGMPWVEAAAVPTRLGREDAVTVPAGAVGWVRLGWKPDRPNTQTLSALLWMGKKDGGATEKMNVNVQRFAPLRAARETYTGTFHARELPRTVWVYCWSSTRSALRVKGRAMTTRGPSASDPVTVGRAERLTEEQRRRLQEENNGPGQDARADIGGPMRCAYRIPVTLRPVSPDGTTPFTLGHFIRYVELSSDDPGVGPVQVAVTGTVLGEVGIGETAEGGLVKMGTFPRSRGRRRTLTLESDVPGLRLELDTGRLPPYLTARFMGAPEKSGKSHQIWHLQVEVLPNRASGVFPRRDDPVYQDSAVYVRTVEKSPRLIRIPVTGTANDR